MPGKDNCSVAQFRIDKMSELCRQMAFTPLDTRLGQVTAAEELLVSIEPGKAYPFSFVVFRLTGYHPHQAESDLLTGLALQHDLGLLIEKVSETLNLRAERAPEPVLTIEDVTARFNVTSKTIQRWRRRGLAARRVLFPDGKRRVGFLLGTVERFLARHRDQIVNSGNFSQLSHDEAQTILRNARRLVNDCGCAPAETARRLARKMGRSPLAIAQVIRLHDATRSAAAHSDQAHQHSAQQARAVQNEPAVEESIFSRNSVEPQEAERLEILRGYRRGVSLGVMAREIGRPRSAIYRVIVEERLGRLNRRKVKFIDDVLYHQADAALAVDEIYSQKELAPEPLAAESRIPRDLPAYLRDLYRTPLLTPHRERTLFLKLNFHKFQFVTARRKIDPQFARSRDLRLLEGHRRDIVRMKNEIIQANLRLVVSVARKHLRSGLSLMELISDGNITLMRAVESFDFHKGNRFSTYATFALMKGFARSVPQMLFREKPCGDSGMLEAIPDARHRHIADRMLDRDEVKTLLSQLDGRERDVILAHYGISEVGIARTVPATYEQLGLRLGLSKQRVRQIEQTALAKLRALRSLTKPGIS
jgi:RNA polymerase sigma factor (sigma-70 family)